MPWNSSAPPAMPAAVAAACAAEEARGLLLLRRWRRFRLGELALEFGDAALGVAQRHILDQHRLHQVIRRIRLIRQGAADERVGLGVLGLNALLREAVEKSGDEVAFLRRHDVPPGISETALRDRVASAARQGAGADSVTGRDCPW